MGNDNPGIVKLSQALTFKIEHVFFGGNFAGRWRRALPFNRLIYILKEGAAGSSVFDSRHLFEMKPGHWLFIPAGHEVEHDQHEGLELVSIHFSLFYYSNPGIIAVGQELYQGIAPELLEEFCALTEKRMPGVTDVVHLQKLLYELILPVLEKEKQDLDQYFHDLQTFQNLFDQFQKELYRNFSIDDMAKVMKMGNESFVKKFKKCMRTSPKKFFNRLRAAAAADRLRKSSATIREIAEEFGFSNEFYFSRFVKQHLGMSPREWRDNRHLRI